MSRQIGSDSSVTLLVNNAGTSSVEPVAQSSVETLTNLIALNVTALTLLTKSVLPGFIERNAGTIINIGSVVKQQLAETGIRFQYVAAASTASEIWDVIGVPTSSIEAWLMDTEACVDAALKGLDAGELSVRRQCMMALWFRSFEEASMTLLAESQTAQPAPDTLPEADFPRTLPRTSRFSEA